MCVCVWATLWSPFIKYPSTLIDPPISANVPKTRDGIRLLSSRRVFYIPHAAPPLDWRAYNIITHVDARIIVPAMLFI